MVALSKIIPLTLQIFQRNNVLSLMNMKYDNVRGKETHSGATTIMQL